MSGRQRLWAKLGAVSLAALVTLIAGAPGGLSGAAGAVSPLDNPSANRSLPPLSMSTGPCAVEGATDMTWDCPSPCFPHPRHGPRSFALSYNGSVACTELVMAAINDAQAAEHLRRFALPSGFLAMTVVQQLFVLVNLERISHGVPPLVGLSPYLDAAATSAARQGEAPEFRSEYGPVRVWLPQRGGYYAFGSTWSGGAVNAAAAVFVWMYDDGWGGRDNTSNAACTGPRSGGCWGHRDELLGRYSGISCSDCIAGAGYTGHAGGTWQESYDFLVVRPTTFPTPLSFTWDSGVLPLLPAGWERVRAA